VVRNLCKVALGHCQPDCSAGCAVGLWAGSVSKGGKTRGVARGPAAASAESISIFPSLIGWLSLPCSVIRQGTASSSPGLLLPSSCSGRVHDPPELEGDHSPRPRSRQPTLAMHRPASFRSERVHDPPELEGDHSPRPRSRQPTLAMRRPASFRSGRVRDPPVVCPKPSFDLPVRVRRYLPPQQLDWTPPPS
jgi:hypothetical protein